MNAAYITAVAVVIGVGVLAGVGRWLLDRQARRALLPHTVTVRPKEHRDRVCAMWPCGSYAAASHRKVELMRDWDPRDYRFEIKPTGGAR